MARPRKEINEKDFESLLAMQCTLEEVTAFFDHKLNGCSEDTIERWCKRTYKQSFAEISSKKRELGKISLRRAGFELAKKNPTVHIFYAKNYLGMTDSVETKVEFESDGFIEALKGQVQDTFKGAGDVVEE